MPAAFSLFPWRELAPSLHYPSLLTCLSVCLPVFLLACVSVCLSICLSVQVLARRQRVEQPRSLTCGHKSA